MIRLFTLLMIFALLSSSVIAQQKYWIYFKDKTPLSSQKDYYNQPLSKEYTDSLTRYGLSMIHQSKWLNAATYILNDSAFHEVKSWDFVKVIQPVLHLSTSSTWRSYKQLFPSHAIALGQINADTLVTLGLDGQGVKIGIIDGGFLEADKHNMLKHLVQNGQVKAYKNFINPRNEDPYAGISSHRDDHGTAVWVRIAGRSKERQRGLATGATYYLARTDEGDREHRGEEDNWIAALEWLEENGVKLVNSSVGYSNGYDNPQENYSPEDVDGQSTAITRAARIAVQEKGMLIVMAAGNDGHKDFKVISIPGDASGVLTVGATHSKFWTKQRYSSIGPEHLETVKPDLACYSAKGTSFSAPVFTGVLACIIQAHPSLSNIEIIEVIKRSGHLYPFPNNYLGYGVPDVRRLLKLIAGNRDEITSERLGIFQDRATIQLKADNVVLFHKKDAHHVTSQERVISKNGRVIVQRPDGIRFTTVSTSSKVIEIEWH